MEIRIDIFKGPYDIIGSILIKDRNYNGAQGLLDLAKDTFGIDIGSYKMDEIFIINNKVILIPRDEDLEQVLTELKIINIIK